MFHIASMFQIHIFPVQTILKCNQLPKIYEHSKAMLFSVFFLFDTNAKLCTYLLFIWQHLSSRFLELINKCAAKAVFNPCTVHTHTHRHTNLHCLSFSFLIHTTLLIEFSISPNGMLCLHFKQIFEYVSNKFVPMSEKKEETNKNTTAPATTDCHWINKQTSEYVAMKCKAWHWDDITFYLCKVQRQFVWIDFSIFFFAFFMFVVKCAEILVFASNQTMRP